MGLGLGRLQGRPDLEQDAAGQGRRPESIAGVGEKRGGEPVPIPF